jgi:acyl-CoA synthetase (AMP-forming)/AMP-acid ligase II
LSLVVSFPINHVACVADSCATSLITAGKIVFQERFDPTAMLMATAEERCNMLGGVPTMLQLMLEQPVLETLDLSSLELIAWGGAAMPREGIRRLGMLCSRLMTLYGLTETSANIVFGDERSGTDALAETIGRPDRAVSCRIVDESGALCRIGEAGELQFRADFFFLGYWRQESAATAAWTDDGWFRTGDIALQRADGNLVLRGRKAEMYKSGGYNIYPREIELALERLPGVALAAVVCVPDPLYQEVGYAWVVPSPGADLGVEGLREACRNRLANYKVPKHFAIRDSVPMLPVGKVDKRALKNMALAALADAGNRRSVEGEA